MEEEKVLSLFGALSNKTRLRMLRALVQSSGGMNAGDVATAVGATPSRASFHLSNMAEAGVLEATRNAREIIYTVKFATLGNLVRYLLEDCCANNSEMRGCCFPSSTC